uniref:Uncharacterized protein n=1 Tax=Romanomermis culicivorax TaxID=13658 RepID=A0A915JIY2_ROMCU
MTNKNHQLSAYTSAFSPSLKNGIKKLLPLSTNFIISVATRLILGSWKLGTDGDSNTVIFVSAEDQNLKKTGECKQVINYSISPEKQEQLLTDRWNAMAMKKKKINPTK